MSLRAKPVIIVALALAITIGGLSLFTINRSIAQMIPTGVLVWSGSKGLEGIIVIVDNSQRLLTDPSGWATWQGLRGHLYFLTLYAPNGVYLTNATVPGGESREVEV